MSAAQMSVSEFRMAENDTSLWREHCISNHLSQQENISFHAAAEVYPVKNIDRPGDGRMSIAMCTMSDTQDVGYKFPAI